MNNHPDIYAFFRGSATSATRRHRSTMCMGASGSPSRRGAGLSRSSAGSPGFRFFGGQHKVRYGSFLREVARAQICIDLPSYSPITFRLIDYLAIGTCIIGPPHASQLHVPLEDRVHLVYCKPDYSDLEELCTHYLEHAERRESLVRNSRRFFDTYLHRDQLAAYYLTKCLRLVA